MNSDFKRAKLADRMQKREDQPRVDPPLADLEGIAASLRSSQ